MVAITTTFDKNSLSSTQMSVPHRRGPGSLTKIQTGLTQASVVDVKWSLSINCEICRKIGTLPVKLYATVKQLLVDYSDGSVSGSKDQST